LLTDISTTPLFIQDHETNNQIQIQEISTADPYKLLGIQMCFNGDNKAQAVALNRKCEKMATAFSGCELCPSETIQGYRSIFLPGARYGMSATTLTKTQLYRSQQLIISIILPKLGFNRNMPRQVVYAPTHFGGIGLSDLYIEQGLAQLKFLLTHLRKHTDITDTISLLIESYMITAGTLHSPFDQSTNQEYVHAPWIHSLQHFLQHADLRITTPNITCNTLIRDNDIPLMTLATQYTKNIDHIRAINSCRIWLQVTTLAEITDSNGLTLLKPAITGEDDPNGEPHLWHLSRSLNSWPTQPKPPKKSWNIWQKMLKRYTSNSHNILNIPLGHWTAAWNNHITWHFLSDKRMHMIQRTTTAGNELLYVNHRPTTKSIQYFILTDINNEDVDFTHPATPTHITIDMIQIRTRHAFSNCPKPAHLYTIETNTKITTAPLKVAIDRYTPTYIGIHTIHSYETQTFTWSITQRHLSNDIKGLVQHTSSTKCATTRGGLIGTLQAIQYFTQHITQAEPNRPQAPLFLCSKDTKIIRLLNTHKRHHKSHHAELGPEQELLIDIHKLLYQHNLPFLKTHLATKHDPPHSRKAQSTTICINQLNIVKKSTPTTYKTNGPATVWHLNCEVSNNIDETIRHAAGTMDLRVYMQDKYGWNDSTTDNIDWLIQSSPTTTEK
jgi:hypothetical protein